MKIRAYRDLAYNAVGLYVLKDTAEGQRLRLEATSFQIVKDFARHVEPTLWLRDQEAQVLMDDLWSAGVRPTEGTGSAGALSTVERHLCDMRTIAFKKLGVEIPADARPRRRG